MPIKILLIEDNPGDARLIRQMLIEVGAVHREGRGWEAGAGGAAFAMECTDRLSTGLDRLTAGGIDVVLLDLSLPDSQGLRTFSRVQTQAPHVPILVLTGLDDESLAGQAVQAGAQDYLVKGQVDGRLLVRAIRYALARKRTEEALAARTRQLEAVRAVNMEITRELDLTTLLELIVRRAVELVGGFSGIVALCDDAEEVLTPRAWHGLGGWAKELHWGPGEKVVGTVAQRREGMIVNDYRASPYAYPTALERTPVTAVLGEPLIYRGRLIGVITCNRENPGQPFTGQDRETLSLFASQAAIAIENARLFESTQQRAAELAALQRIDHAISARLDLPAVLEAVVTGGMEFLGAQHVQVALWDESTQTLSFGAARGTHAEGVRTQRFERGKGANATVALTHEPMIVNDYQASPYALPEFPDVVATITVPILFEDRLLGVLNADSIEPGKRFTPADLRRLQMLAVQAAIAIENGRLFEQVLRAKTEWEKTFDSIPDLVAIIDAEGRLVRVNRAMAEHFHVSPGDLVGQRCYTVMHGTETPWPGCPHAQTLTTGESATLEVEDPHLGGAFLITTAPIRDEQGRMMGSVHIARDITEMKRLAEETQQRQRFEDLSRAKSAFIASMSHELRTPLNSVIGFSELLLEQGESSLTEKQARYLGHIRTSGKHLLALISDILDLSKVEAGKIALQPQELPVATTVDDILMIARGLANKKGQAIQAEVEPDLPLLTADPVRFKQILFNLLSNAVKFTPEGGRITVTARQVTEDRRPETDPLPRPPSPVPCLELRVSDTGAGIRPEDMPRLFREFSQLETTQAQKHEGAGLGLALTKRLVELHGGRISAESAGQDRGSTFTVVLAFAGPGT